MRRRSFFSSLIAALLVGASAAADEEVAVPVALQIELLIKVAAYDKNLPARAPSLVKVLIVSKRDDGQSSNAAQQAQRALAGKVVANRPTEVSALTFSDGPALAARVREKGIAVVYVAPGFNQGELESIARALEGVSVLSTGAVASFVQHGVVLSFDLVGGKPKLLVHLARAQRQKVDLSAQVLKLVKVVE
jgi:hypothetical protein